MNVLLNNLPIWIVCCLFLLVALLVSLFGLYLFRRYGEAENLKKNHDVTGIIYGAVTIIYSLVLAFVIVAVWNDYEEINGDAGKEAAKLMGIISHSEELPDSVGGLIRKAVISYTQSVIDSEGNLVQTGVKEDATIHAMQYIRKVTFHSSAENEREQVILRLIHDDISDVADLRQDRLMLIHSHVPGLVWLVLIAGSFITIFFSYFFFVESTKFQYLVISFLTVMIAMCLFLVYVLDHPSIGSSRVTIQPFLDLIRTISSRTQ